MTEDTLLETIREHLARICALEPGEIETSGKLVGYGLDSIRAVELILTLEEELGVELSEHDPELSRVETLEQLADLIGRRRAGVGS